MMMHSYFKIKDFLGELRSIFWNDTSSSQYDGTGRIKVVLVDQRPDPFFCDQSHILFATSPIFAHFASLATIQFSRVVFSWSC